ncbi:MAG: caspase family protein, partial [Marinibacterium sp.]|nr:caspase family protein [Marinibacterium sp.]
MQSRLRAVLVGVGDYLHLDADLQGPPNDVRLMSDMLLRRGVAAEDIVVLSDPGLSLPGNVQTAAPTKSEILDRFAHVIDESAPGDTVLFYFSGHGTQAPDQDGDEQGGADELFLPRDAGAWNGGLGEVENAIRDDDLGALVARATAKGVRVVGIVDACHSATGFRAVGEGTGRARYIAPETLNIPEAEVSPTATATETAGDYVFLYAAQSDQRAFEYPMGADEWYGDFTRNLVNVLQDVPALSYDQLAQAVAQRLRTKGGQAAQTPEIEGPMAGQPVFGGDAPALRRIVVEGTVLKAGLLQDLTEGSEVTLYADLTATEAVGLARVTDLRATEADLTLLEPYPTVRVTHAEVTTKAMDVSFRIAIGPKARAELDRFGGVAALQAALDLPISDQAAQTVVWDGTGFALVGRDGVLDAFGPGTSPRLMQPGQSDDPITDLALALMAHARRARLEQALEQMAGQSTTRFALLPSGPDVQIQKLSGALRGNRCRLTGEG